MSNFDDVQGRDWTAHPPESWPETAAMIFAVGKIFNAAAFPALPAPGPGRQTFIREWGTALSGLGFPGQVWPEAVRWWLSTVPDGRRWSLSEAKRAAEHVQERWRGLPASSWEAGVLESWTVDRMRRRGLPESSWSDRSPAVADGGQRAVGPGLPDDGERPRGYRSPEGAERFRALVRGVSARRAAEREAEPSGDAGREWKTPSELDENMWGTPD